MFAWCAGGIFSMHALDTCIVTASKDGIVATTLLLPGGGLAPSACWADLHGGDVVKCARWGPPHMFASCGNDRRGHLPAQERPCPGSVYVCQLC
jgi:hypothetical protein